MFFQTRSAKFLAAAAAVVMTIAVVGYAMAGSLGRVVVKSTPPGAQVIVGGQVVGTTPATLKLPANNKVRVQVKKKGFKTKSFTITPVEGKSRTVSVSLKRN
jgi:hypothetical protein